MAQKPRPLSIGYCDVNTRSVGVVPLSVPLRALNSTGHTNLTVEGNAVTSIGLTLVNCQLSGSFVIGSGALTVGDMEQVYTVGAGSFYAEGEL